jgi:alkylated DNA repair dioxygenase AlkB
VSKPSRGGHVGRCRLRVADGAPKMLVMQQSLFADDPAALPLGARFVHEFIAPEQEDALVALIDALPLAEARYKQYTARRRVLAFGGKFDYDSNELRPAPPIPPELLPLRAQIAQWLGAPPECFSQMLLAQYRPGTPLGWHRDVPDFESIVGLSLGGQARMKFRPYPPPGGRAGVLDLVLPPRSIYVLEGPARWQWQHGVAATTELRYSITLRTRRGSAPLLKPEGLKT